MLYTLYSESRKETGKQWPVVAVAGVSASDEVTSFTQSTGAVPSAAESSRKPLSSVSVRDPRAHNR